MQWLAPNPAKRAMEKWALAYSPIWMAVVGAVEFSGALDRWGDAALLALGVGLALPLAVVPLIAPPAGERGVPLSQRHSVRWNLLVVAMSFLQCYFGSWLFFDRFGMQYHFHARLVWNRTPLFLYFLTVAYFGTYYAVLQVAWRAASRRFPSRAARLVSRAVLSYAVAFAETAAMATPRMAAWFSYADPRFVMRFGSICYGTVFFVSLPLFARLDEERPSETGLRRLVWDACAANLIILIAYQAYGPLLAWARG